MSELKTVWHKGAEVREEDGRQRHSLGEIFRGRHLDLVQANRSQLLEAGVERIFDSGLCTSCRSDIFYSWRRRKDRGRMWALAGFAGS